MAHTLTDFRLGSRVRIADSARYVHSSNNPRGVEGTVYGFGGLGVRVRWDNGGHNSYLKDELVSVERKKTGLIKFLEKVKENY